MFDVELIVVGGGIVGLAVARAAAQRGCEVVLVEAEAALLEHTSSRNSEVVHAGLYYPRGSRKAQLCRLGNAALYAYCRAKHVPHRRLGKLVIATCGDEVAALRRLCSHAQACGADELQWMTAAEVRAREPWIRAAAGLWSPRSGIVDSHALAHALAADAESEGATIALRSRFHGAHRLASGFTVHAGDTRLTCKSLVNAAGPWAPAVARTIAGLSPATIPSPFACKGSYFRLRGPSPFTHLVYPLPSRAGLGIHVTLDLAGNARFGPDVEWVAWSAEPDYRIDPARRAVFAEAIARYAPGIDPDRLEPDYAGIRPKLVGPGQPASDFVVSGPSDHGVAGLVNLYGIESPGLTACLPLADVVVEVLVAGDGRGR